MKSVISQPKYTTDEDKSTIDLREEHAPIFEESVEDMSSIGSRELHAAMFKKSDVDLSTNDLRELHASIFKKDQMQVVDASGEKIENRLIKTLFTESSVDIVETENFLVQKRTLKRFH